MVNGMKLVSCPDYFSPSWREKCGLETRLGMKYGTWVFYDKSFRRLAIKEEWSTPWLCSDHTQDCEEGCFIPAYGSPMTMTPSSPGIRIHSCSESEIWWSCGRPNWSSTVESGWSSAMLQRRR